MSTGEQVTPRREIELDFLRGLAILAVVDYHSTVPVLAYPFQRLGFPPFGWVGVDLFFVLSGFLVGGLLVKEWLEQGKVDGRRFLVRRGFKIWPQYYLFILLIVLSGQYPLRAMWSAFVHLQNYFIAVPHLWTLALEERAYLLLVVVTVVAARHNVSLKCLFWWLGIACALVVFTRLLLAELHQPIVYGTHTRIEAILYGVLLAIVFHTKPEQFRRMQSWRWLWFGLVVLALGFIWLNPPHSWAVSLTFDAANLLGISLLMLIYQRRPQTSRSWPYRAVAWIGLYSYGIYLWHPSLTPTVLRLGNGLPTEFQPAWTAAATPLCGIALGVAMTKLVEFPMLRLRDHWFPGRVRSPVEGSTAANDPPVPAAATLPA